MRRHRRKKPLSPEPLEKLEALEKRTLLAAATINFNDVHQTVDGFGSESAFTASPTTTAIQQAYSVTNGIGLTFLRGSINQDGSTHQEDMMKQAAAFGVKLVMSARAAPSEWITNYNTTDGGDLLPSHYQDYANLLADSAQKWAASGIPIYALDFAVEPDLATTTPYTYMVWSEQQFADVLPFVANTFRARGIATKIMLPESFRWDFSLANQIMADPALSQYVDVLAAHAYDHPDFPYAPVTNAQGRPVWMTEYIVNNSALTPTQNAVNLASDIHSAFTAGGASTYLYFWMSDGTTNGAYLMTNWTPNKRFWAMGNYSKFVRPGWVRVGESDDGGIELTTFKDLASGKFAIVVDNPTASSVTETYTLSGLSAANVTPYITSTTEDLAQHSAIALTGGSSFSATIAAGSVVTYYGISSASPSLQPATNLTVDPVYSAQTTQLSLNWSDNSTGETAYRVERSTDDNSWSVLTSTLAPNTTSYIDTTAAEGSAYYYRVKASSDNTAPYSAAVAGSTILAAPSNLSASAISGGLHLAWTINSAASSGVTIQRSIDGLVWSDIAALPTRATSYDDTIPGYNATQVYFYRVRNTLGSVSSAFAQYDTTIKTPTNFRASLVTPNSVTFNWTNNAVGAFAAVIQSAAAGYQNVAPPNLLASAGSFAVGGLTENISYTFRLAVVAGGAGSRFNENYGDWSAYSYVTVTTPIAAPTNLIAISTGASTAQLTWTDNSAVETGYTVERSTDGSSWTTLTPTPLAAGTTSYADSSAPGSGTVYYRVKALASAASSAYVRTQLISAAPMITTPASVSGTSTTLSVTPPAGFGSGTLLYTWSLDNTPTGVVGFSTNGTSRSNNTTATFTAAGAYTFRVTITDSAGDSASASAAVTVQQTITSIAVVDSASRPSYGGPAAPTPAIVKSTFQQLSATAYDQFGAALTTQPSFTWSVPSGGGSVSSAGLYTAGTSAGSPVVRAAAGAVTGNITLTVLDTAQLKFDYSLNEGSGTNVQDSLGVGDNAYLSGGTSFVTGRMGKAVQFNGVNGSIWVGRDAALDIRNQITLAAWIKPASSSGTQSVISRSYGLYPNQSGTFLRISSGQYQAGYFDSGGSHSAAFAIPSGDVGNWVHLVGTYDGKTWRLYRNGTQVATLTSSHGSTYVAKSWRIGSTDASPAPSEYFNGVIDSVRLYAQALSATEITALYNQSIVVTSPASASPASGMGSSMNLAVAAVDPDSNADSLLTYTWSTVSGPGQVTFSATGSNAAKTTLASFSAAGTYNLKATISDVSGLSTTSTVSVTVNFAPYVQNNHLYVNFGGSPITLDTSSGNVTVASASFVTQSFDPATFADILVNGTSGDDALSLRATLPRPMSFTGGSGNDSLTIGSAASYTFAADASQTTKSLNVTVDGAATFATSQTLASLRVDGSATITSGGGNVLSADTLLVNGTLDLGDGALILHNADLGSFDGSAYTGITGLVASGRNGGAPGAGIWNGHGIITTMPAAQNSNYTTVAVAKGSDVLGIPDTGTATWLGRTIKGSDILVKYTYGGDANLDGKINIDDYIRIDAGIASASSGWFNGDFNYDGRINIDDYTGFIDANIAIQGPPLSSASATMQRLSSQPEVLRILPITPTIAFGPLAMPPAMSSIGLSNDNTLFAVYNVDLATERRSSRSTFENDLRPRNRVL